MRFAELNQILERLSISEEPYYQSYRTSSPEDYKVLVEQALNGRLDGVVSVGRSGIYFNEILITPPEDTPALIDCKSGGRHRDIS